LISLKSGHSRLEAGFLISTPLWRPISGGFRVVQIEFGHFDEMIRRKIVGRLATKQEADAEAEHAAKRAPGKPGYNDEQGYWWSRDVSVGKAYRYVVEAAE
jgi:hypothetical protein